MIMGARTGTRHERRGYGAEQWRGGVRGKDRGVSSRAKWRGRRRRGGAAARRTSPHPRNNQRRNAEQLAPAPSESRILECLVLERLWTGTSAGPRGCTMHGARYTGRDLNPRVLRHRYLTPTRLRADGVSPAVQGGRAGGAARARSHARTHARTLDTKRTNHSVTSVKRRGRSRGLASAKPRAPPTASPPAARRSAS